MRFIAVLDDCNDSKEAGNDRVQEEGEGERKKGRREERERRRREEAREKRGRIAGKREKEKRERKASEGKERKGKDRERGRKSALGERGARSTCTLYERNPRRRRWAVVHFMHDYARLY